jgi:hypothetical protein
MTEPALQFESAEPTTDAPAGLHCGHCRAAIETSYFDVDGAVTCRGCKEAQARDRAMRHPGRFVRAALYGSGAAVLGSLLYYAVSALTGYELGIIGIAVGFAVGVAVKKASRGRGGWAYQGLAVALTYLAIVSTYAPALVGALMAREGAKEPSAQVAPGGAPAPAPAPPPGAGVAADAPPPTFADALVGLGALLALLLALPFLAGLENVIGLAIIGFSLFEAWKLNRATPFVVTGPYDARTRAQVEEPAVG